LEDWAWLMRPLNESNEFFPQRFPVVMNEWRDVRLA
jgi:hypothetical protein